MKRFALILAFLISSVDVYGAAPARGGRNASGGGNTSTTQTARAARTSVARGNTNASTGGAKVVSRSASPVAPNSTSNTTSGKTSVGQRGRSATTPTSNTKAARAAKQNVVNTGTKVAAAAQNTVVDEECWNKFSGCMDSFCMMDNANGGRCLCSNKNSELDAILEEIQKLDNKSYQMATVGVERIEMGEDVDAVIAKTEAITKGLSGDTPDKKSRRALDLTQWNATSIDFEAEDDIFANDANNINQKTGDALYLASYDLCTEQIAECGSQFSMIDLMYKQRVRSDCTAYENSLKQQRTQSAQKLASAEAAMREAALEQHRSANKYDLGQCTLQFKQCMQTTAGCGEDFAGCVTYDYTSAKMGNKSVKPKKIKGATTTIEIAASTYDVLDAKKPMCMGVTKECVNVRDQVWDTFLRESAPELKSAELIAESNVRMSCTQNISECFQKACKDNIDPNDPEGSYDMCLTRPDTLRSLCKVQIDPCEAAEPKIMDYVRARLASMRVDSCTKEFKQCLQSEDRCGEDYTQCIGLDADTIVGLCPTDKLVGCQYEGKDKTVKSADEITAELSNIVTGILLSVDNQLLDACLKGAQKKVLEVCGSLAKCSVFDDDAYIGTESLVSYKNKAGDTVIDGLMNFGLLGIKIKENPKDKSVSYTIDNGKYNTLFANNSDDATVTRIKGTINEVATKVQQTITTIATDPTVDMCINGRKGNWRGGSNDAQDKQSARFPHLLDSYSSMILNSGLDKAYANYNDKYDKLVGEALEDQNDDVKSALCAAMAYSEGAPVCTSYATTSSGNPVCVSHSAKGTQVLFGQNNTGMQSKDGFDLRYVIKGADITAKLNNAASGKGEYVSTDNDGNMVSMVTMTSVYSPGTNICTLTTTTLACENMRAIITTSSSESCSKGSIISISGSCGGGWTAFGGSSSSTTTTQSYHGNVCSKFGDPITETKEIKM